MAATHAQALASVTAGSVDREWLADAPDRFFVEALSPFEIAHRGYRDANTVLHKLNEALEDQAKRIAYALHGEASQTR